MIISTARLDPTSLAYLQRVEKTRGASGSGAFFFMRSGLSRGAVTGWLIVLGLAALGIAAFLAWPGPETEADFTVRAQWQTGLAVVGVLFLGLAVLRIVRGKPPNALGSFRYFDPLHMWVVSPGRVEAVSLESLKDIDGTLYRGSNNYAKIVLSFPQGRREFAIPNPSRSQVEYLVRFVHTMIRLRNSDDAGLRALAQSSPNLLGEVAARLARGESVGNLGNLNLGEEPPRPTEVDPPQADPARGGVVGALLPWLAAAAVGAAAFFLAPRLDRRLLDEYLFGQISAQDHGDLAEIDAYLNKLPDGSHAPQVRDMRDDRLFARIPAEDSGDFSAIDDYLKRLPDGRRAPQVHEMRDDRLFDKARREADENHSPSSLRQYLADATNVRHRDDAQTRINVFYDEAIARLKKQAEGKDVDESMFQAVLALLDGLKKSDNPVVTVGFHATQDPTPTTPEQTTRENEEYAGHLDDSPELKSIAENAPEKTAILPLGDTFTAENTKVREAVILDQLRESVKKVLDADIITLEPAPTAHPGGGEMPAHPIMEVTYHAYADGSLYLYTTTVRDDVLGDQKKVNGLLRGYEIEWTITVRPPNTPKVYDYKVASKALTSLHYDSDEADPSWAPYAIILYSGFEDMSRKLIQDFGVEPPEARDRYRFAEVVHQP